MNKKLNQKNYLNFYQGLVLNASLCKTALPLTLMGILCLAGCSKLELEELQGAGNSMSNNAGITSTTFATGDEFTIAVIGDTQNHVDYSNDPDDSDCQTLSPFQNMINWIITNKSSENIQYVVSVGDITDNYGATDAGAEGQWIRAHDTYEPLKPAGIPFGVVPGNHDINFASRDNYPNNGTTFPANPFFYEYFGRPQFWDYGYNKAGYPNSYSNQNHYDVISTPAGEFMILYLRWHHMEDEADDAIVWAYDMMVKPENLDRRVIIVTHSVVASGDGDDDGQKDWGMQRYHAGNYFSQGDKIYNKFKSFPNFFMFLGGHTLGEHERQDTYDGTTVKSFTTDFSNSCGSGSSSYPDGVMRTMKFSLSKDLIEFKTFIPGQPPINHFFRPWYHSFGTSRTSDFNNNGKSEPAFFDNGIWKMYEQPDVTYGTAANDIPVPGDYDADGKTDIAIFREGSTYNSWLRPGKSSVTFGQPDDLPAPGDYDGNGTTDFAFFRPSEGMWYVRYSYLPSPNYVTQAYGTAGDIPVAADYDGDGKVDYALFRPSTAEWFRYGIHRGQYGYPGDIPVPGDYNGDGIAERSVYRPSNNYWYIYGETPVHYGQAGDIPVPGDYDGDGTTDIALYRPTTGRVYVYGQAYIDTGISNATPVNLPYAIRNFFFP